MKNQAVELNHVIYNATSQSFEALAIVHFGTRKRTYACSINAPIDMSFEDAAKGLSTQALRRHNNHRGLSSDLPATTPAPRLRTGRSPVHTVKDAFDMLRNLAAA